MKEVFFKHGNLTEFETAEEWINDENEFIYNWEDGTISLSDICELTKEYADYYHKENNSELIKDIEEKIILAEKKKENNLRIWRVEPASKHINKAWGKFVAYADLVRDLQSILSKLKETE